MTGTDSFPFDPQRGEAPLSPGCASWSDLLAAEPELGAAVEARFLATKHHVLATLRSDGAPRVSGTEVILDRGVLAIGSMWQARKAADLRHDGRFALHSNPGDGSMEGGDAKVNGTAVELHGALATAIAEGLPGGITEEPFHLFRLDLSQVVLSEVDHEANCMVIRSWWPDRGLVRFERT